MRLTNLKWFLHFTVLICAIFTLKLAHADTLETHLSENSIALGEAFTVSFSLNGNSSTTPDFTPLENDFNIISKNYGNAINMLNGVTTIQKFWQLTLQPKRPGELIVPEIDFGSAKSTAQKIVVTEIKQPSQNHKDDAETFVKAEVSTSTPYIQSEVLYTFKLFYQSQLTNPRIEVPQIKDATIVQLGNDKSYQTTIHGKSYYVAEKSFLFYPQKSGKMVIPATNFQASVYKLDYNNYNDRFYMATPKPISLETADFTLQVRKIPDNYQGSWLPAKNLSLTEKWSTNPSHWEMGNPMTRTITVEVHGLRADQIADLSIGKISGVNIYVDPPKRSNRIEGNSVIGTMEQNVTYIPSTSSSFSIPALKLHWWNLTKNTNAIAELKSITVQAIGNINKTPAIQDNPIQPLEHSANTVGPATETVINPFHSSIWFWIAMCIFVIWLITLWLFWKRKTSTQVKADIITEKEQASVEKPIHLSEESFKQACEQGNAALAQQYLFSWAKKQWPNSSITLNHLSDLTNEEQFKTALKELEKTIYTDNTTSWNGYALLTAYYQIKKQQKKKRLHQHKTKNTRAHPRDPLPPLNP